jgi:hypothetical protein
VSASAGEAQLRFSLAALRSAEAGQAVRLDEVRD